MRRFFSLGFLMLACAAVLTGCPPEPRLTLSGEDPGLVGTWEGTVTNPGVWTRNVTIVFTLDEFNIVQVIEGGEPIVLQGIYAVDQTSLPNRIDLGITNTSTNASELRKDLFRGIYERTGDSLTISLVTKSFLDRPLDIESGERIYELTRVN